MSWPAKSPDLNPLDFYFWGEAEAKIQEKRPTTIKELQDVVRKLCERSTKKTLLKVADNFMKRAEFCYSENGGNFKHLLDKLETLNDKM